MGRRTPAQMLARSEKALEAFRRVATELQDANDKISAEKQMSDDLVTQLETQIEVAKATKAAFKGVEEANTKRIAKVNDWLDNLD